MDKSKKILEEFDSQIAEWKSEIGEIPEPTCPSIDKLIKEINSFADEVEFLRKNAYRYDSVEDFAKDLPEFGWNNPTSDLDGKLRKDNEKLRELGQFWYEKCKETKAFLSQSEHQGYVRGKAEETEKKNIAYRERNQLVAFLSKLYPSHLAEHPIEDENWEKDWRTIICIHSPAGQLTWHIHDSEADLFFHLGDGHNHWDGHTTEEKYKRLSFLSSEISNNNK